MKKHERSILLALFTSFFLFACNLPAAVPAGTEPPAAEATEVVFTVTPSLTALTAAAVQECSPIVTTNTVANVRSGPGIVYNVVGNIPQGGTAPVAGKSFDGAWWYIQFAGGAGGYAWIAGSVTSPTCIPTTLAMIAAPPAPLVVPTNTPIPGAPDPTDVPTSSGPLIPPLLLDPPLLFFLPTFTPTPIFIMPDFDIPIITFP